MTNKRPHMDDEGLERQREALREALRLCNRQIAERGDASPALNQQQPCPAPPPANMPTPAPAAPAVAIAAATPPNPQPTNTSQPSSVAASNYAATPTINRPPNSALTPAYSSTAANPSSALAATPASSYPSPDTASVLSDIANNRAANRPAAIPRAAMPVQPLFHEPPPRAETPPAYEEYTYRGRARGRGRGRAEGGRAGRIYTIFVCLAHDQIYCQQCCRYVSSDVYWARHPELTEQ